jgi:uncharacterized protein (TIGR03437 family)
MRHLSSLFPYLLAAVSCTGQTAPAITPLKAADGLDAPTMVTSAQDGSGRLYVVEQPGRIRILRDGKLLDRPFLDIQSRVLRSPNEQGMVGLVFPPGYAEKTYFYVLYTALPDGQITVARYRTTGDLEVADPSSEEVVLTIVKTSPFHNGGMLAFGPDGYLYIGGEEAGDYPYFNAQNPKSLLGKILRIDTESGKTPYAIPPSNPYASNALLLPEIWAYGLRNPWRFSFDRANGDLWIGDVGQDLWEEVDWQPAGAAGGINYGWAIMEGAHCYNSICRTDGLTFPVFEYNHDSDCAVVGGYLYRGQRWPAMQGWYIFGDFCSGRLRALQMRNGTAVAQEAAETGFMISSFGEDEHGELYVADRKGGAVYLLAAGNPSATAAGLVNAASFSGTATAGSLATLFGVGLTTVNGAAAATEFPLPTTINGTSMTLDGIAAPLLAVANVGGVEQVNLQVPWELEGRTQASLVVANNGMSSAPVTIPLAVQPGMFAGSRSGTLLQLWATGLGPVLVAPANGQAAAASTTRDPVHVLVNGSEETVEYAGLAPGFAGLYQVNVRLPESLPVGQITVSLVAGGTTSNTLQLGLD